MVVEFKRPADHAMLLRLNLEEKIVKGTAGVLELATKRSVLLMESGPIGGIGSYAVSRALEERRADYELAPIHRHDLEAGTAAE